MRHSGGARGNRDGAWARHVERVAHRLVPGVPRPKVRQIAELAAMRPTHLAILAHLVGGPGTAREIAEALDLPQPMVGRDLRALLRGRLVARRVRGRDHRSVAKIEPDVWRLAADRE